LKTYSSLPGRDEESRIIPCPLCGETDFRSPWECGDFRFVRCSRCGCRYQNPQILSGHALSRYDEAYCAYERENEESFLNLMKLGLRDAGFDEWENEFRLKGPVLDVGCATGALIGWLSSRGWEADGLEICPSSAAIARSRGCTVYEVPLEEADIPDGRYSLIHASHVIEHVNDPDVFVRSIYRLLKPGGRFICVTPNTASLQAFLRGGAWRSAIADHLVLFSGGLLRDFISQRGFAVLAGKTWGGAPAGTLPAPLKRIADRGAKRFNLGDVVLVSAEKKLF